MSRGQSQADYFMGRIYQWLGRLSPMKSQTKKSLKYQTQWLWF